MLTLRSAGPRVVTSLPPIMIWPDVGDSSPAIIRRVVVLPQPEGPRMVVSEPFLIQKLMPLTASGDEASGP